MMLPVRWVISDDPKDWVGWLGLLVTTLYVIFTYRLMRSAVQQANAATRSATLALRQAANERLRIWLPVQTAIDDALAKISSWHQKYAAVPFNTFVNQTGKQQEAHIPHLLELVSQRCLELSPTLFHNVRSAADSIQKVAIDVTAIWPYSGQPASVQHYSAALSEAANARAQLTDAKNIVDPFVEQIRQEIASTA